MVTCFVWTFGCGVLVFSFLFCTRCMQHLQPSSLYSQNPSIRYLTLACLPPSFFPSSSPPIFPPLRSCCRVVCCQYVGAPQHHSILLILHAKPRAESDSSFHPGPNHIAAHNNLKPSRPLTLTLISQPPLPFLLLVFSHRKAARGTEISLNLSHF